ncbi:MAG TPA: phosphotransacetylase family protein [Candidatus Baltobacteraceae bacterium]|nr:phosphotransacetylase family protein [Candidatus Baltobacteraceae bacterium]
MRTLLIGSTVGNSGKTMVTIGLAPVLEEHGYKVGFIKPVGKQPVSVGGAVVDADAQFLKEVLHLAEPMDQICPVVVTQDLFIRALRGEPGDVAQRIQKAFDAVSAGKDVVLMGGAGTLADGGFLGVPTFQLIRQYKAPLLLVDPYHNETCIDCILMAKELLGDQLFGVVLNRVTPQGLPEVEQVVVPFLSNKGVEVLGVIPLDRLLDAITVRQLVDVLQGKVICGQEGLDEFVERFSVGAMDTDAALGYFQRLPNKAVITGGNRADIQLAALETSTRCLVLTGDQTPNQIIVARARDAGIPIVVVSYDTLSTVEKLEAVLGRIRIRETQKVRRAQDLLRERLNYRRIIQKLSLK